MLKIAKKPGKGKSETLRALLKTESPKEVKRMESLAQINSSESLHLAYLIRWAMNRGTWAVLSGGFDPNRKVKSRKK